MKPILENWRKYLKEELLTEFDRSDKQTLMDEQDRFTISYEIELESRDDVGDTPAGREEYARNYLTYDYFHENQEQREVDGFWNSYLDDDNPEPWELVNKYLQEEYDDTDASLTELILFSIGVKEDEQNEKEFNTLYNNIIREGSRESRAFIEMLQADPDIVEDLKNKGVALQTARQRTLPLGDDTPEEETVALGLEPDVTDDLVKSYLFDPQNDNFIPNQWAVDKMLDLKKFLELAGWGEEGGNWIDKGSEQIETFIINGGASYPTVGDLTYFDTSNWSFSLKAIAGMVESASQSWLETVVQEDWEEYQEDPVDYLDGIGYDWEDGYTPEDSDFMELLEENFPRFMKKWADQLKFEEDGSLRNGIEFSMDNPIFMTGLDTAFEFLKDFFFDYNRQDNFQFDHNTGLHTNIGYLDEDEEIHKDYNLMKALLFLNHDFALKEFGERKGTRWALDLKSDFAEKIEKEFKQPRAGFRDLVMMLYKEDKLDELGRELSQFVEAHAPVNPKTLGFNIHYIDRLGYIEFRYPGDKGPTLEKMKNATLYYAYVVKQAVDPTFKKKDYEKKLVKLMSNLAAHIDRPTDIKTIKAFMQKGGIYLFPNPYGVSASPLAHYWQYVLGHSLIYTLYGKDVGIFKGIRKGKTLKDTVAVFKTITEYQAAGAAALEDGANYKIGEITIPLPKLERMIVNGSIDDWGIPTPGAYTDMPSNSERIANIFKAVKMGSPHPKPPPKKKTSTLQEIKVRILK